MKRHPQQKKMLHNRQGLILVMTLWILAFISILSIGLAHTVSVSIKSVQFQRDNLKRLYCAKAGLQKAIGVLTTDTTPETDALNEPWSTGSDTSSSPEKFIFKDVLVGDGVFTIRYDYCNSPATTSAEFFGVSDEERKININKATKAVLEALFSALGFEAPSDLADAVCYWRGDAKEKDPYYESADIPYAARQAPFKTLAELSLIKGFRGNDEMIKQCQPWLTVLTNDNLININTAPWIVLKAVFAGLGADQVNDGLSGRLADNVIAYRAGVDQQQATIDDTVITRDTIKDAIKFKLYDTREIGWVNNTIFPFTVKSKLFRIEETVHLQQSKATKKITAIVERQAPGGVVRMATLRYWHEE